MERKTVNLLELSDSQKAKFLEQARTFLKEQVAEARFCKSVAEGYKIQPKNNRWKIKLAFESLT